MTTLAQIGCGYWGPNLLRTISNLPGVRAKWLAEMSPARQKYVAEKHPSVQVTPDWTTVLADPEVDGVLVATPASTHFNLTRKFLEAGKHVFVEKPLAMTGAEAAALGSLAAEKGRILMVGHTFLYNPVVRWIKNYLASGELGQLYCVYCQRLNLGQLRKDVNAWWNLAPHDLAILLYMMDDRMPDHVEASGKAFIQPGIEDVVFASLSWNNGPVAHVHVSWLDPHKTRKIVFVGSKKMLVYDDVADDKVAIYDKGFDCIPVLGEKMDYDQPRTDFTMRSGGIEIPAIPWTEPLRVEMEHFVSCITTGAQPLTGPDHGRKVVELLERTDACLKNHA